MEKSDFHTYLLAKLYRDPEADPMDVFRDYAETVRADARRLRRMHELQDEVGRLERQISDIKEQIAAPLPAPL